MELKGICMAVSPVIRVLVLVPVHKALPDAMERVSLRQCGKVLQRHEIRLLAPAGLDVSAYASWLPGAGVIRVDPVWMASREAYNRMMIAPLICEQLPEFTHLLVHEPDAMVFRDELEDWCARPHDYIGAPWFEGFKTAAPGTRLEQVGNFGLSLHRLDAMREVLSSSRRWYPYGAILRDLLAGFLRRDPGRLAAARAALGRAGQLRHAWRGYGSNCDLFWALVVPPAFPGYRVAPVDEALRFAWEVHPRICMDHCQGRLPFGIHAWARYDLPFLWSHMRAAGVDLEGLPVPQAAT